MANYKTFSTNKFCITCNFWGGARTPAPPNLSMVECASTSVEGDCFVGGFKQPHKRCTTTCSKWQKWPVLK